jgi:hypothetical protein
MFRVLPVFGGDPRAISEVVNGVMNGKTNNHGTVTLNTGNATSTIIYDERISPDSKIILIPWSSGSFTDATPYGAFHDNTDQIAAAANTDYAITLDTTDFSNGVTLSNNSRINVENYGIYNIQFSVQFANSDSQIQDTDIWFRKNGTNVVASNSQFSIQSKHGSIDGHLIAALNFWIELNANDYVELIWSTTNTNCKIEYIAAQTSPTRPVTPSVIVTVNYVSSNGTSGVGEYGIYVSSQSKGQATITHYANSTADKTYAYVVIG